MNRRNSVLPLTAVALASLLPACAPTQPDLGGESSGVETIDSWTDEQLDVYFVPGGMAAEARIAAELDAATSSIRVAMYNLRSERLGYALLARQQAGVDVEVLWDAKQMAKDYNTLDDDLAAAGLNIVPIQNDNHIYATLHDKLAVIDDHIVFMGSANWGDSALHDNNESTLVFDSPALAEIVDNELDEIASGDKQPRTGDADSRAQLYFSPEDRLDRVIEDEIDAATDSVHVAVFSLRLSWLTDALIRAHERGVEVFVVTDQKQSSTTAEDDRLADAGIGVIEALNDTSPFTAMHHKFAVIDGDTTMVGAYNWSYTATFWSYEDLVVIRDDVEVARAYEGEINRLWKRYGDAQIAPGTPTAAVSARAFCDATAWGDTVRLVGDLPELGAWDPHAGVPLSGDAWPNWAAELDLPIGVGFEYKLVLVRGDGSVEWERGDNRVATVPTDGDLELDDAFRW